MSKAKTGGGHGMTTDPLDGLEQLRRIIDEQPEPAPESVMLGLDYCYAEWVAERARHAEEVARLKERLAVQERATNHCGTVLGEQKRRISDLESENDDLRSSVRSANVTALSALSGAGISTPEEGFPAAGWGELGNCIVRLAKDRDSLRDQLRKVEGERDALAVRMDLPASQLLMVGSELCGDGKIDPNDHRDPRWTPTLQQAAKVMRDLTSLRSLLPDVRACAEYCRNMIGPPPGMPVEDYPLPPVALAARRILAALDSQGGEGE